MMDGVYLYVLLAVCFTLFNDYVQCIGLPSFNLQNPAQDIIQFEYRPFHRRRRAAGNEHPYKIQAKLKSVETDINLKFHQTEWRHDSVPLQYYCGGVKHVHTVASSRKHCISIYSDQQSKATALVDFCVEDTSKPHMIIELSINNTQHVILPVASQNEDITHQLFRVDVPALTTYRDFNKQDTHPKAALTSTKRYRRADLTSRHTVELMLVIDYTLYKFWYDQTTGANRQQQALDNIRSFYSFLVNAMDMRYQGMSTAGLNVRVELVHIWTATTPTDSPWIEDNLVNAPSGNQERGTFGGPAALFAFESWIKTKIATDPTFPKHDHAMLVTGRDLTINKEPGAAGYANLGEICTVRSQSVVEDHFNFLSVTIFTHELGHSLGADHDGDGNACSSDDMFIMATINGALTGDKARNPWTFSSCSATSIKDTLTSLNSNGATANCLLTKENGNVYEATGTLLGQKYNPNQQCQFSYGSPSLLCMVPHIGKYESLCTGIWCAIDGVKNCSLTLPADGTTCGNKKWCTNGQCVSSNNAPEANDDCLFGDQLGIFASGLSCSDFVTSHPESCYQENVRSPCCTACSNVKEDVTGCEYGDSDDCTGLLARSCYDEGIRAGCCKTCANFKRTDLPEGCEYGDRNAANCEASASEAFCQVNPVICCASCKDYISVTTEPPTTTEAETEATGAPPGTSDALDDWVIPVAAVGGGVLLIAIIVIIVICCRNAQSTPRHSSTSRHHRHRHRDHGYRRDKPPSDGRYGRSNGRHAPGDMYSYDNTANHHHRGNYSRY